MSCPRSRDDAAYVLGALSPADRLDFERHLAGCDECARAVREVAGLPALLGRVDASVLEHPPVDEPVPATLLPALSREVRRVRRRRASVAAVAAAAAIVAAVTTAVAVTRIGDSGTATPDTPSASVSTPGPQTRAMRPVGDVPVRARLSLEEVAWGTKLGLTCTYDTDSVEYDLPPAADYLMVVRTRDGRTEQVGSWRSISGRTMQLSAGTASTPEEIASVEVRTTDGRVVLALAS